MGQGSRESSESRESRESRESTESRDFDERIVHHPYRAVAAALGVGYAIGGNLFPPLTSRVARLAVRVGIRTALRRLVTERIFTRRRP